MIAVATTDTAGTGVITIIPTVIKVMHHKVCITSLPLWSFISNLNTSMWCLNLIKATLLNLILIPDESSCIE
jgi:hypothetical protein